MATFTDVDTPETSSNWRNLSPQERIDAVNKVVYDSPFSSQLTPTAALPSGFVYVELEAGIRAAERGVMLRAFELFLKKQIDEGITVWCEPVGDKSALRKLRGIEVKAV